MAIARTKIALKSFTYSRTGLSYKPGLERKPSYAALVLADDVKDTAVRIEKGETLGQGSFGLVSTMKPAAGPHPTLGNVVVKEIIPYTRDDDGVRLKFEDSWTDADIRQRIAKVNMSVKDEAAYNFQLHGVGAYFVTADAIVITNPLGGYKYVTSYPHAYIVERHLPGKQIITYKKDEKDDKIFHATVNGEIDTLQKFINMARAGSKSLKAIHDFNLVHEDIHPMNVLIEIADAKNEEYIVEFPDHSITKPVGAELDVTTLNKAIKPPEFDVATNKVNAAKYHDIYCWGRILRLVYDELRTKLSAPVEIDKHINDLINSMMLPQGRENERPDINAVIKELDQINLEIGPEFNAYLALRKELAEKSRMAVYAKQYDNAALYDTIIYDLDITRPATKQKIDWATHLISLVEKDSRLLQGTIAATIKASVATSKTFVSDADILAQILKTMQSEHAKAYTMDCLVKKEFEFVKKLLIDKKAFQLILNQYATPLDILKKIVCLLKTEPKDEKIESINTLQTDKELYCECLEKELSDPTKSDKIEYFINVIQTLLTPWKNGDGASYAKSLAIKSAEQFMTEVIKPLEDEKGATNLVIHPCVTHLFQFKTAADIIKLIDACKSEKQKKALKSIIPSHHITHINYSFINDFGSDYQAYLRFVNMVETVWPHLCKDAIETKLMSQSQFVAALMQHEKEKFKSIDDDFDISAEIQKNISDGDLKDWYTAYYTTKLDKYEQLLDEKNAANAIDQWCYCKQHLIKLTTVPMDDVIPPFARNGAARFRTAAWQEPRKGIERLTENFIKNYDELANILTSLPEPKRIYLLKHLGQHTLLSKLTGVELYGKLVEKILGLIPPNHHKEYLTIFGKELIRDLIKFDIAKPTNPLARALAEAFGHEEAVKLYNEEQRKNFLLLFVAADEKDDHTMAYLKKRCTIKMLEDAKNVEQCAKDIACELSPQTVVDNCFLHITNTAALFIQFIKDETNIRYGLTLNLITMGQKHITKMITDAHDYIQALDALPSYYRSTFNLAFDTDNIGEMKFDFKRDFNNDYKKYQELTKTFVSHPNKTKIDEQLANQADFAKTLQQNDPDRLHGLMQDDKRVKNYADQLDSKDKKALFKFYFETKQKQLYSEKDAKLDTETLDRFCYCERFIHEIDNNIDEPEDRVFPGYKTMQSNQWEQNKGVQRILKTTINNAPSLVKVLNKLAPNHRIALINHIGVDELEKIINTPDDVTLVINLLPDPDDKAFVKLMWHHIFNHLAGFNYFDTLQNYIKLKGFIQKYKPDQVHHIFRMLVNTGDKVTKLASFDPTLFNEMYTKEADMNAAEPFNENEIQGWFQAFIKARFKSQNHAADMKEEHAIRLDIQFSIAYLERLANNKKPDYPTLISGCKALIEKTDLSDAVLHYVTANIHSVDHFKECMQILQPEQTAHLVNNKKAMLYIVNNIFNSADKFIIGIAAIPAHLQKSTLNMLVLVYLIKQPLSFISYFKNDYTLYCRFIALLQTAFGSDVKKQFDLKMLAQIEFARAIRIHEPKVIADAITQQNDFDTCQNAMSGHHIYEWNKMYFKSKRDTYHDGLDEKGDTTRLDKWCYCQRMVSQLDGVYANISDITKSAFGRLQKDDKWEDHIGADRLISHGGARNAQELKDLLSSLQENQITALLKHLGRNRVSKIINSRADLDTIIPVFKNNQKLIQLFVADLLGKEKLKSFSDVSFGDNASNYHTFCQLLDTAFGIPVRQEIIRHYAANNETFEAILRNDTQFAATHYTTPETLAETTHLVKQPDAGKWHRTFLKAKLDTVKDQKCTDTDIDQWCFRTQLTNARDDELPLASLATVTPWKDHHGASLLGSDARFTAAKITAQVTQLPTPPLQTQAVNHIGSEIWRKKIRLQAELIAALANLQNQQQIAILKLLGNEHLQTIQCTYETVRDFYLYKKLLSTAFSDNRVVNSILARTTDISTLEKLDRMNDKAILQLFADPNDVAAFDNRPDPERKRFYQLFISASRRQLQTEFKQNSQPVQTPMVDEKGARTPIKDEKNSATSADPIDRWCYATVYQRVAVTRFGDAYSLSYASSKLADRNTWLGISGAKLLVQHAARKEINLASKLHEIQDTTMRIRVLDKFDLDDLRGCVKTGDDLLCLLRVLPDNSQDDLIRRLGDQLIGTLQHFNFRTPDELRRVHSSIKRMLGDDTANQFIENYTYQLVAKHARLQDDTTRKDHKTAVLNHIGDHSDRVRYGEVLNEIDQHKENAALYKELLLSCNKVYREVRANDQREYYSSWCCGLFGRSKYTKHITSLTIEQSIREHNRYPVMDNSAAQEGTLGKIASRLRQACS